MSLALWLRAGRSQRGMSLDDVARVTKIQARILERLEAGKLDGLPAEVFVRGFVRSFARCVGLDEEEALRRYRDAASQPSSPAARALVESMSELAPVTARASSSRLHVASATRAEPAPAASAAEASHAPERAQTAQAADVAPVADPVQAESPASRAPAASPAPAALAAKPTSPTAQASSGKRKKNRGKNRKRKAMAAGTPAVATPVVEAPVQVSRHAPVPERVAEPVPAEVAAEAAKVVTEPEVAATVTEPEAEVAASVPWTPKMPTVVAPTVPWRRPAYAVARPAHTAPARMAPSLVIDDADPELAEREREDRAAAKEPTRRMFLPPILLDREDRSARQGGLTLAVIILLIAATLTLSYLMRRPSSSGDGVTQAPPAAHVEHRA